VTPRRRAAVGLLVAAVALAALPLVVTSQAGLFLATTTALYAVLAVSWNLTLGFGGIYNFAHLAFFALGAYASAILTAKTGASPWLGLVFGAVVGLVASVLVFVAVLRLRGIYVALVTFVFAQVCFYVIINQQDLTGGAAGLAGVAPMQLGNYQFLSDAGLGYYVLAAALLLASLAAIVAVLHSTFGRGLIALKDNEEYAISRGVAPVRQQILAFNLSGAIAGCAGAVYAHAVGVVSPGLFGFGYITLVLSMILLGGVGSAWGPVIGAVVVSYIADRMKSDGLLRDVVLSMLILGVLWVFPTGLVGAWAAARRRAVRLFRRRPRTGATG
jgi:branched-chain amino acid transport system permease protein